ncbi:MAG: DUF2163 domain-containing protein [Gammaproteobacteria bacterium]|jgi:hypothetical protein|nr:DUF2163 domain-containing protein [Gammaproteobacteria bacterium]
MDRGSTAAFQAEVAKSQNRPVHFVSTHLDSGTTYMTDSYRDIIYDGNTYGAVGAWLDFSDIEETAEVIVSSVTISLSGVDQTWISAVLQENYIDRTIKIYKGFLNSSQALITDPILIFEGRIDQPIINENPDSGQSTVSMSATNAWVDFSRKTGRHSNHEEQQIHFSGDMGFEFASEIVRDIPWGGT